MGFYQRICKDGFKPICHVNLNPPIPEFITNDIGDVIGSYTTKIMAEVVDASDKVIVDVIIREATAQGVNDLCLIDKEFVMTAIKNEIIRRSEHEG